MTWLVVLPDGQEVYAERVTINHGGVLECRHDFGETPFFIAPPGGWLAAARETPDGSPIKGTADVEGGEHDA